MDIIQFCLCYLVLIPLPALPFKSWRSQNLVEARDLVTSLLPLPNVVIMGDVNSGPEVVDHNVEADFEGRSNDVFR